MKSSNPNFEDIVNVTKLSVLLPKSCTTTNVTSYISQLTIVSENIAALDL